MDDAVVSVAHAHGLNEDRSPRLPHPPSSLCLQYELGLYYVLVALLFCLFYRQMKNAEEAAIIGGPPPPPDINYFELVTVSTFNSDESKVRVSTQPSRDTLLKHRQLLSHTAGGAAGVLDLSIGFGTGCGSESIGLWAYLSPR